MQRENPPSPARKAELFLPCVRKGKPIWRTLTPAQAKGLNHCAAFASGAAWAVAEEGEEIPHSYRAGAKELMDDAIHHGSWVPASKTRSGWRPEVGDLAIYDRSQPDRPETAWWGHVDRVSEVGPASYRNIGANEGSGGAWVEQWTPYQHPKLLGFITYPQSADVPLPEGDETDPPLIDTGVDWGLYQQERRKAVSEGDD